MVFKKFRPHDITFILFVGRCYITCKLELFVLYTKYICYITCRITILSILGEAVNTFFFAI